jgi:hypothetical protein
MLTHSHGLLDQVVQVLWDLRAQTFTIPKQQFSIQRHSVALRNEELLTYHKLQILKFTLAAASSRAMINER